MSKRLMSTLLLMLIGAGFAIASFVMFVQAHSQDDIIQAILYAVPAVAAFVALFMLPSRQAP
jgi:hypothetical protein